MTFRVMLISSRPAVHSDNRAYHGTDLIAARGFATSSHYRSEKRFG